MSTIIIITSVAVGLGATTSHNAAAQPVVHPGAPTVTESAKRDTSGLIVPRFGSLDGTVGSDPYMLRGWEFSILVQPWCASTGLHRGLFASGRVGGLSGDHSSFHRGGFELGYLYRSRSLLGFVKLGASMSATMDRWAVWVESPGDDEWHGKGTALGAGVRPFVRLGRFEISVPFEVGYGFGPGEIYQSYGVQIGLVLF